jgi:trk/ktr system potassium uptake protein
MLSSDVGRAHRPRLPVRLRAVTVVLMGFVTLIAIGTGLLLTPLASTDGTWTRPMDALFTAVSAASDTGLVVVDTADHWSFLGEVVIAGLIFVGGLGIMASATLAVAFGRRTSLDRRSQVSDAFGTTLGDTRGIVRRTIAFAIVAQIVGAVVLAVLFTVGGEATGAPGVAWAAVFHAVSAFNNAGFDIVGGLRGFTVFAERPLVLVAVGSLVVVGGLGYLICADIIGRRTWRRLALETKLVLVATVALMVTGAIAIALLEWNDPATLGSLSPTDRVANSVFMSVSSRSAGFNTLDMAALRPETDLVVAFLMFIGAASGSTAGGVKVNTVAVLVLVVIASSRDRPEPEAFGRRVSRESVHRAITVLFVAAFMNVAGTLLVASLSTVRTGAAFFETVSAFGTVGLSIVGTATYDDLARLALAGCMFLGRIGPLALVILLFGRAMREAKVRRPEEPLRVG